MYVMAALRPTSPIDVGEDSQLPLVVGHRAAAHPVRGFLNDTLGGGGGGSSLWRPKRWLVEKGCYLLAGIPPHRPLIKPSCGKEVSGGEREVPWLWNKRLAPNLLLGWSPPPGGGRPSP